MTSPLAPEVAKRSERKLLNCKALIAPVCFVIFDTKDPLRSVQSVAVADKTEVRHLSPFKSLSASHRLSVPSSKAPAMTPFPTPLLLLTQAISWNLANGQESHEGSVGRREVKP